MAVFYNTTGGGVKSHTGTSPEFSPYRYATKIVVPSGYTVNITGASARYGCTAFSGVYIVEPSVTFSIYDDDGGEPSIDPLENLFGTSFSGTEAVQVHSSGVLDVDLSAGTYWVVATIAALGISGSYTIQLTENTGETNVLSDDGLGHAGASGPWSSPWTWSISSDVADLYFSLTGTVSSGPAKPTSPNPSNGNTTDPVYDRKLSWSVGNLGNYDTMGVYLGTSPGSLSLLETITPAFDYTVDEGDWPQDSTIYWRVDGTKGGLTTTGDEWNFDPTPGVATNPTPIDGIGNVSRNQSRLYWDGGKLFQTFDVYFGLQGNPLLIDSGVTTEYWDMDYIIPLAPNTNYEWYIVAKNANGSATSDTWSFRTGGGAFDFGRPGDYDADLVWDIETGDWVDIGDIEVTGGGRYKQRIIVVGHQVIYFGDV